MPKVALSLLACLFGLGTTAAMAAPMVIVDEAKIAKEEPTPHGNIGRSSVYRVTDSVPNRLLEFRKRIMPKGSTIGLHKVHHDEIFYVISGTGEVTCDGVAQTLTAGMSAYIYNGSTISIGQKGDGPFTIILSYPLPAPAK